MRRFLLAIVMMTVPAHAPVRAASMTYPFSVGDGVGASLEVAIPVEHEGALSAEANWSGGRILAFRLIGPGSSGVVARRSGPSPQRLVVNSDDRTIAAGPEWRFQIRANAAGGAVEGVIVVEVPDSPEVVAAREAAAAPPPPVEPDKDPWTLPAPAPPGGSERLIRVHEATELLRAAVFGETGDPASDGCGWQAPLVRWTFERRREIVEGDSLDPQESRLLARTASAIRGVDRLRLSDDPLVVGPVPDTSLRRRAWLAARRERLRPLERQLDALAEMSRDPRLGDLADEPWISRMVACLTACERHFDQRHAPGAHRLSDDLVDSQWDRFLAAATAFEALTASGGPASLP